MMSTHILYIHNFDMAISILGIYPLIILTWLFTAYIFKVVLCNIVGDSKKTVYNSMLINGEWDLKIATSFFKKKFI